MEKKCKICLSAATEKNVLELVEELQAQGFLQATEIIYAEKDEPRVKEIFEKHYIPLQANEI